jgi:hypothetical protein
MKTLNVSQLHLKDTLNLSKIEEVDNENSLCTFYWYGIKLSVTATQEYAKEFSQTTPIDIMICFPEFKVSLWHNNQFLCEFDKDVFLRNFQADPTNLPIRKTSLCANCTKIIAKVDQFLKDLCLGE